MMVESSVVSDNGEDPSHQLLLQLHHPSSADLAMGNVSLLTGQTTMSYFTILFAAFIVGSKIGMGY